MRAFEWFNIGADQFGQGLLILPLVGRGRLRSRRMVIVLAMLHMLFALGMLLQKSWAWWLDLSPSVISILLVLNIVVLGEPASRAAFWMIVPIIIAMYLLPRSGHAAGV